MQRFSAAASSEKRLLPRKQGFGEHLKEYGNDVYETYVHAGWEESDPIKMATGVIMAPASVILEGTAINCMRQPLGKSTPPQKESPAAQNVTWDYSSKTF